MAGYSGTPLPKKLGIKAGARVTLIDAPAGFEAELTPLPPDVTLLREPRKPIEVAILFAEDLAGLRKRFASLTRQLAPDGLLWVAWPKKSSGVATDLSFEVVQRTGLEGGLVDTKICAINEVWSGLRFVRRLKDRG